MAHEGPEEASPPAPTDETLTQKPQFLNYRAKPFSKSGLYHERRSLGCARVIFWSLFEDLAKYDAHAVFIFL